MAANWRHIEVDRFHALNRTTEFVTPLEFCGRSFTSLEQMIFSICLAQHRMFGLSESFWYDDPKMKPCDIYNRIQNLFKHYGFDFDPGWVFELKRASVSAMLELMNHGDNDFAREMSRVRVFGRDVLFVYCTTVDDRFFGSGFRPGRVPQNITHMGGLNLYGEMLGYAYNIFYGYEDRPRNMPVLYTYLNRYVLGQYGYRKSAVIISDSTARHARSLVGGSIWCESGLTCSDLASKLLSKHANLMNFRYVIIFVTTNDSQLPVEQQEASWRRLKEYLLPLKDNPDTKVIINTGIGVPRWPYVQAYTGWFRTEFLNDFNCRNFVLCDWSRPAPYNVFLSESGQAVEYYLDGDLRHPNEHGLKAMWRYFVYGLGPDFEDLRLVKFLVDRRIYLSKELEKPRLL